MRQQTDPKTESLEEVLAKVNAMALGSGYKIGTIDDSTITTLHTFDKEALISLIQRVSGAMWGVALKTREQREEAILLRLATLALTSGEAKDVVATAREYFDRVKGKPIQQVNMDAKLTFEPLVIRRIEIPTIEQLPNCVTIDQ